MAQNWYPASALTSGDGALTDVDGSLLADGDRAIVITSTYIYFYLLDDDSGASATPPGILAPSLNPGTKRWILIQSLPNIFDLETLNVMLSDGSENFFGTYIQASGLINATESTLDNNVSYSSVLDGQGKIKDNCAYCIIVSCASSFLVNQIRRCMIAASYNGTISTSVYDSAILGGFNNSIFKSSNAGVFGGQYSSVKETESAFAVGEQCVAGKASGDGNFLLAHGRFALANIKGQKAFANGSFDIVGDAQTSDFVLKQETDDNTVSALLLNTDVNYFDPFFGFPTEEIDNIPIMFPRSYKYKISIVARQIGGTAGTVGDSAMWEINGGIKNIGGSLSQGTVSFTGAPVNGDTITLNGIEYTFRNQPELYEHSIPIFADSAPEPYPAQINAHFTAMAMTNHPDIICAVSAGSDVVFTAFPNDGVAADAWSFSCSGTNISCDGSGTFGETSAYSSGTISLFGDPQGTGTPVASECDAAIAAQGTITMSGLPVADETFIIDTQTFTWKASRSTTGEVTIGVDAAECVTNIVTAVGLDLTTVAAEDGDGDTVVLTAVTAGSVGNSVVFTESSTNMAVDGSGTIGGTTEGDDRASLWESTVSADDTGKGLKILVKGETNKLVRWVADVKLIEVG